MKALLNHILDKADDFMGLVQYNLDYAKFRRAFKSARKYVVWHGTHYDAWEPIRQRIAALNCDVFYVYEDKQGCLVRNRLARRHRGQWVIAGDDKGFQEVFDSNEGATVSVLVIEGNVFTR